MSQLTIEGYRLSPQQKTAWRVCQDNNLKDCVQIVMRIDGKLDRSLIRAALNDVVERNEILRTRFQRISGLNFPVQVIADAATSLSFEVLDSAAAQNPATPLLDLENGPTVIAHLIAPGTDAYRLAVYMPVFCSDIPGITNIIREIIGSIAAPTKKAPVLEMQYADFAEWQNELLEETGENAGIQYWQSRFSLAPAAGIPAKSKPEAGSFRPCRVPLEIEKTTQADLVSVCLNHGLPVPQFLSSVWRLAFARLTGECEAAIGVMHDGRRHDELKNAPGLYARYLPEVVTIDLRRSFLDLVHQSASISGEDAKWQEYWQAPQGFYFPACFEFAEGTGNQVAGGVTFHTEQQFACFDRFEAKLVCIQQGTELQAEIHYDSSRFAEPAILQLGERLRILLADAVKRPEYASGELRIMGEAEQQELLAGWNQSRREYRANVCVHDLTSEQASQRPGAVAAVCGEERLTYAQLNAQANRLANELKRRGVRPESRVGLFLERSLGMIVGIVGVLKAGGAYVPLDARHPADRISFQIKNSQMDLLITQSHLANLLPQVETKVLLLEELEELSGEEQEPSSVGSPENLAYVMYTSGSTGRPKGVGVDHRQLVNYVFAIQERLEFKPGASMGLVSTFAADLGYTMLFPALCCGGTLVIANDEEVSDPKLLEAYLARNPVDYLKIVPAHLRALMSGSGSGLLPRKAIVLGGETLSGALVNAIRERAPECDVVNHYGPTETTVGVVTFAVPESEGASLLATVPLGRPLGNLEIYILDEFLKAVPKGTSGEIYIGGAGVTRGYLGRPDLTAECYLPNPFHEAIGTRMYRTGDHGRMSDDGNLEFLGRKDDQTKIRGFRIELGEVESALQAHPQVRGAVVVVREDTPEIKQLAAYFTIKKHEDAEAAGAGHPLQNTLASEELRRYLETRLPDYMVPAFLIELDRLPLMRNGKVDRQALPAPDLMLRRPYIAPRTPAEKVMAGIWADVLGCKNPIGINDNFFELGGHSLLATQVLSRLRSTFRVEEFPLMQIFKTPTISGLVAELGAYVGGDHIIQAMAEAVMELDDLSTEEIYELLAQEEQDSYHSTNTKVGIN